MPLGTKKRIKRRWGAPWTLAELKRLGKTPDSILARRTGRTIKEVVTERERKRIRLLLPPRRWTAREIKILGRYSDSEVARRLRRDINDVRQHRRRLHIPPLRPLKVRKWTRAQDKLLGTRPDREVAKLLKRKAYMSPGAGGG